MASITHECVRVRVCVSHSFVNAIQRGKGYRVSMEDDVHERTTIEVYVFRRSSDSMLNRRVPSRVPGHSMMPSELLYPTHLLSFEYQDQRVHVRVPNRIIDLVAQRYTDWMTPALLADPACELMFTLVPLPWLTRHSEHAPPYHYRENFTVPALTMYYAAVPVLVLAVVALVFLNVHLAMSPAQPHADSGEFGPHHL